MFLEIPPSGDAWSARSLARPCAFLAQWNRPIVFPSYLKSFHTAVTAELETWLKTLKTNLRIIALPPLTPDSPTRTRPGTAGPIIWVRLWVKVKELSTHFSASEMKPKHNFFTKQEPESLFYEILKDCCTAVCMWLLELLPSPNPVEVCRSLNLGLDLNPWYFQLLLLFHPQTIIGARRLWMPKE